uniref:Uncharacterized protein n=1 Tax=Fagus sylvatica TaxID=28930 RepID=A0A2N9EGM1_FAGSY
MSTSNTSLPTNTTSSSSNNQTPIFLLSNISTYVTVKLDHNNFLTWKFQITHILEAYSLLEYVEGFNTCPPRFLVDEFGAITTQVNYVYSQWQARDKALMSLISATLSPSAHSLIISQSSAFGMWTVLLKRYTSVSRSNILNLKKQLHDVKKNTDTVTQYLQRIKESRDKIAAVGTVVDDEDLLHIVLKGLPSKYESFSTAMLTKSDPVSFEELHILMITQEELLKSSQENSKENSIMAMAANKGRHPPAKLAALASAIPPSSSPSCWISDTSATDHFTPDLGNLLDSSIYNDSQLVSVGNGQQLPISHMGNAQLYTSSYLFKLKNILRVPSMASNLFSDRLTGKPLYKGLSRDGLYPIHGLSLPLRSHLSPSSSSTQAVCLQSTKAPASASTIWHARFGHPQDRVLRHPPPSPGNTHPMVTRSKNGISKRKLLHTTTTKPTPDYLQTEPPNLTIASKIPEWTATMRDEFDALQRQHTWSLVPQSVGHNVIGCRWVFKLKRNSDGSISRYKARLVAKGFHQQPGLNFDETFSPVVKPPTVRIVLSLAAQHQWSLRQLDISNVFLHGFLKEDVFMIQPPAKVEPNSGDSKAIKRIFFHVHAAPRAWFERFTSHLLTIGFTASTADPSLFVFRQDLGPLRYFLGLQIEYGTDYLLVHQRKYITDLLSKFNMHTCKAASTPFSISHKLQPSSEALLPDPTPYHSLVGALQYATFTRPDITYAVNQVCQYMHKPTATHFAAAKRILRYLQGTLSLGICFRSGSSVLTAFTDSDWAGDLYDRRSTTGITVFLGNNPITWVSKKQHTVSRSSTEAEYRALASGAAELAWIRQVLCDLGIVLPHAPIMWCDNTSAIALASNPVFHSCTKHIEVDYHFVRERVVHGDLSLLFISTDDQLADLFTKPLSTQRFQRLTSKLMFSTPEH